MNGKNIAVLYGGGQIPSANIVLGKLMERLLRRGDLTAYGVHKSFWGLSDSSCYEEFTIQKAKEIQKQIGTYLSTCRKVNPAEDKWFEKIISNLKEKNIRTIMVPGGDGSSRAGNALIQRAKEEGYELQVVFMPCTIDGINGSDTIGIDSAVAESERQASLIMVNAFATWNPNFLGPRVAIIEMQGRNRNDIAVNVMKKLIHKGTIGSYHISDIDLIFIPAGHNWSYYNLLKRVNSTERETAIIVSEGAEPTESYWNAAVSGNSVGDKIKKLIKDSKVREANLAVVGYLSQANDQISEAELKKIQDWVSFAVKTMYATNESIAIIKTNDFETMSLEAFAKATESEKAIPLGEEDLDKLKSYLP